MNLREFDISHPYTGMVRSNSRITPDQSPEDVREIVIDVEGDAFDYQVGQVVGVLVPGPHAFGHDVHFRLYTLADTPQQLTDNKQTITLVVKRNNYIDDYSGEEYKGIASNYLCDLKPKDHVSISGPYGHPFEIPEEKDANLLMIGLGTGIAPFRAFIKHIYDELGGWKGKVRLFYGARTGLEMLYLNDYRNDLSNYFDEQTFRAFEAVSPRPHWGEDTALAQTLQIHKQEVWDMVCSHNTHVYVAGLAAVNIMLDEAFSEMAGSGEKWLRRKRELIAGGRWTELIY
jgi:ferredoxin--NADP+ reductase